MADSALKITGATEFRSKIKRVRDGLPKTMHDALNDAKDLFLSDVQPRIPRRTGRAAASLHVKVDLDRLHIEAGGSRAPYFGWLDFGGNRRGRGGGIARRPYRASGRYVLFYLQRDLPKVVDTVQDAVLESARHAGLQVSRG